MGSRIKESPESMYEVFLEVSQPGIHTSGPEVRRQYPADYTDQETLNTVPKFCFPFSMDSLTVNQVGQNFTFVLTDIESKQRFGFCRLSSGAHTCYCILSYLPWFEVFYKLLNILADYTIKGQESNWQELLVSLHTLPIPEPGVPVHLGVHSFFTVPDTGELPSIPENRNLTEYFVAVDVNNMLHLYASMLYERRILICCSKLSTLTACVHGSAAMMYPMHWQHVYIPVLPQHLLDYCCAPMPYLIGVHSSLMEKVRGMALDDVVVLNVDTNTLETPYDDLQSLPNDVVSSLKSRLKKVSTTTGDGVARAFLKSQAALFGSYRNALQIEPGEPITFNEDTFVNHRSSAMRQFLLNAIQLQLFKQFIDGRLDLLNAGEGFSDIFEDEINMGEYAGSDKTYHQWLFTVKKGGGAIFNTVKTRANPAMKNAYKFAKDHAKMRIKEVKSRLKQKEQAENGFPTTGSAVIDDDDNTAGFTSSTGGAVRREGPLRTLEDHRPITVHFGQARPPMLLKRPSSNVSLESSVDHSLRPTRHYTVFLSEDSSGDELQYDDESISALPESFLFSAPFEWSPLPQPYRSLKEVELIEADDPGFAAESHTAPPSPVTEKFSNINLLGDIFGCQDEPDSQHMTLAKSLEDLRTPKDSEELQAKFTYQRMDLSVGEHSRTLPGLKLSNLSYNKLWSIGAEESSLPVSLPLSCSRPPSVQLPVRSEAPSPSRDTSSPAPDPLDPSSSGNITIPRPHGRKTPELGGVLAPPGAQSRSKPEGGLRGGGQEFRQALTLSTDGDLLKPSRPEEDNIDLISLLDPLKNSALASSAPQSDGVGVSPSSCKPPLPPRPYPQGLPPFPQHPQVSLNPFTPSMQHPSPQMHYALTVSGNPFSSVYRPPPGSYLHTPTPPQSFSSLPGLYRQQSPGGSTLPPTFGLIPSAYPTSLPPSCSSDHALSSLAGPTPASVPSPPRTEGDSQSAQDLFGDLLTLAKPATPKKKKVEDLRRRWETFD
ncbi:LOW QUALITY PROTEIN: DENN domain-containing protein 1A [Tautogolabrus adspersus]